MPGVCLLGNKIKYIPFVQFNLSVMSDSLRPHGLLHARPPCLSPTLGIYSDSCLLQSFYHLSRPGGSEVKVSACNAGDLGSIPGSGRSPGEEMATHSSILAWRIPRTEEPGGLQSVGVTESDTTEQLTHTHTHI